MKKAILLSSCTFLLVINLFTAERVLSTEMSFSSDSNTALPGELLAFNAISTGHEIDLEWATASTTKSDYFTVERSKDGITFERVITIAGKGNRSATASYSTIDKEPFGAISYYRLKQTDMDGAYSYSPVIPVELDAQSTEVAFTNSPSKDHLDLLFLSADISKMKILVYDQSSSVVQSKNYTPTEGLNTFQLDLSELTPGSYFVITIGTQGESKMKFIKE